MAISDLLDDVPFVVRVERLENIGRLEQVEQLLEIEARFLRERYDVAIARAIERIEAARAGTALNAHASLAEQAAQHFGDAECAQALVHIDEVEFGRGVQL